MRKKNERDDTNLLVFLISMAAGLPFSFIIIRVFGAVAGNEMSRFGVGLLVVLVLVLLFIGIVYAFCSLFFDETNKK